jgi:hypothetical protein
MRPHQQKIMMQPCIWPRAAVVMLALTIGVSLLITGSAWGESALSIYQATLMEPGQKAPEVSTEEFSAQTLPGARNLPLSAVKPGKDVGEVKAAKDDGRLPMEDHNTRLLWT